MSCNNGSVFCAIRGPIMLITIGALFALQQFSVYDFHQTWPVLLIVFGVLKLLERVVGTRPQAGISTPPEVNS